MAGFQLFLGAKSAPLRTGTGATTLGISSASVGTLRVGGIGPAGLSISSYSAGTTLIRGAGGAGLSIFSSAVGKARVTGIGSASIALSSVSGGKARITGAGANPFALSSSSVGRCSVSGSGASGFSINSTSFGNSAPPTIQGVGGSILTLASNGVGIVLPPASVPIIYGQGSSSVFFLTGSTGTCRNPWVSNYWSYPIISEGVFSEKLEEETVVLID